MIDQAVMCKIIDVYTHDNEGSYYDVEFSSGATRQVQGDNLYWMYPRSTIVMDTALQALWDAFVRLSAIPVDNPNANSSDLIYTNPEAFGSHIMGMW